MEVNNRQVMLRDGITDKHTLRHKDNHIMVNRKVMQANNTVSLKDMAGKHKVMAMKVG